MIPNPDDADDADDSYNMHQREQAGLGPDMTRADTGSSHVAPVAYPTRGSDTGSDTGAGVSVSLSEVQPAIREGQSVGDMGGDLAESKRSHKLWSVARTGVAFQQGREEGGHTPSFLGSTRSLQSGSTTDLRLTDVKASVGHDGADEEADGIARVMARVRSDRVITQLRKGSLSAT